MWYNKIFSSKFKSLDSIKLTKRKQSVAEIFLSTYNSQEVIKDCLESVIPQLNSEIKLIIIDDFSKDRTSKLITELIKNKPEYITFIQNQKNYGLSINLYRLLESSNAVFGFRMDSDDIACKDRFSFQLKYMKNNHHIDILGSQVSYINKNKEIIGESNKPISNFEIRKNIYKNPMIHPTIIFRIKKILEIGNYNFHYPYGQDYELWMRATFYKLQFENLSSKLLLYRKSTLPKYNIKTLSFELCVALYWLPKIGSSFYKYLIIFGRFIYRSFLYIKEQKNF